MAQELLHLVNGSAGLDHIGGEGVPRSVRMGDPLQPGPRRQPHEQLVDRARLHRRTDRWPGQVHQHHVAQYRLRTPRTLDRVLVERLHQQEVHRHRP
ncbi:MULTISPECIES: hypothetical protein [unclassified Streptomyces]|uniref:hypothetical protein n=1 Tax=Streptomyces sp. SID4936 TaxID=2690279 RepID=UPI001F2540E1|nr:MULTISPECIES: hypothetical protein [unclassified Streptomyces]